MKKHKTKRHTLDEETAQRLLKLPVLSAQRERRANIIRDFSLARLKVKGLTTN